jgi:hypothetical protein
MSFFPFTLGTFSLYQRGFRHPHDLICDCVGFQFKGIIDRSNMQWPGGATGFSLL